MLALYRTVAGARALGHAASLSYLLLRAALPRAKGVPTRPSAAPELQEAPPPAVAAAFVGVSVLKQFRALAKESNPSAPIALFFSLPEECRTPAVHAAALESTARSARASITNTSAAAARFRSLDFHRLRGGLPALPGFTQLVESNLHLVRSLMRTSDEGGQEGGAEAARRPGTSAMYDVDEASSPGFEIPAITSVIFRLTAGTAAHGQAVAACEAMEGHLHALAHAHSKPGTKARRLSPVHICSWLDSIALATCSNCSPENRREALRLLGPPHAEDLLRHVTSRSLMQQLITLMTRAAWGALRLPDGSFLRHGHICQLAYAIDDLSAAGLIALKTEQLEQLREGMFRRFATAVETQTAREAKPGKLPRGGLGASRTWMDAREREGRELHKISMGIIALAKLDRVFVRTDPLVLSSWARLAKFMAYPAAVVILRESMRVPRNIVQVAAVIKHLDDPLAFRSLAAVALSVPLNAWGDYARILASFTARLGSSAPAAIFSIASRVAQAELREAPREGDGPPALERTPESVLGLERAFRMTRVFAPHLAAALADSLMSGGKEGWPGIALLRVGAWLARCEVASILPAKAGETALKPVRSHPYFGWMLKALLPRLGELVSPPAFGDEDGGDPSWCRLSLYYPSLLLYSYAIAGCVPLHAKSLARVVSELVQCGVAEVARLAASESIFALRQLHMFEQTRIALLRQRAALALAPRALPRNHTKEQRAAIAASPARPEVAALDDVALIPPLPLLLSQAARTAMSAHERFRRGYVPGDVFGQLISSFIKEGFEIEPLLQSTLNEAQRRVFDTFIAVRALCNDLNLPPASFNVATEEGFSLDIAIDWGKPGGLEQDFTAPHISPSFRGIAFLIHDYRDELPLPIDLYKSSTIGNDKRYRAQKKRWERVSGVDADSSSDFRDASVSTESLHQQRALSADSRARTFILRQANWLVLDLHSYEWLEKNVARYAQQGGGPGSHTVVWQGHADSGPVDGMENLTELLRNLLNAGKGGATRDADNRHYRFQRPLGRGGAGRTAPRKRKREKEGEE
jgi:hypothetical protein